MERGDEKMRLVLGVNVYFYILLDSLGAINSTLPLFLEQDVRKTAMNQAHGRWWRVFT